MYCRPLLYLVRITSQLSWRYQPPFPLHGEDLHLIASFVLKSPSDLSDWNEGIWRDFFVILCRASSLGCRKLVTSMEKLSTRTVVDTILAEQEWIKEVRGTLVLYSDPEYPLPLKAITDPPVGLLVRGTASLLRKLAVSVVGSRRACPQALEECFELGRILAEAGCVVVSGGAYGCDIMTHKGVLATDEQPAPAIIVQAGGLGEVYPKGNLGVFRKVLSRGGAIVSERLPWIKPLPRDFPVRNRIVAGISLETIVMQAGLRSGAMITGKQALDQGRDVHVLDLSDLITGAEGNRHLLLDGARKMHSAADWLASV